MKQIESVLSEHRTFPPPPEAIAGAHIAGEKALRRLQRQGEKDPVAFWEQQAEQLHWQAPWKKTFRWKYPHASWFIGGRINAAENCVDRHLGTPRANKAALIWEGEPGDVRTITYRQLHRDVCAAANMLEKLGVKAGDVVGIYMGMIPEAVVAMLACARIGATHNVVFGGFSADAVAERMNDSGAVVLITQDGAWRRGTMVALKDAVNTAIRRCASIRSVVVVKRTSQPVKMKAGRDHWWHEMMATASPVHVPKGLDAEHPLFILYTSGSTGKPKGILHTTGGYLTQAAWTMKHVFDLREDDIYFCTADIGWITGHSYVVYGPLANGATLLMYEGAPMHPQPDRLWEMIARHQATILYTAPTAIRAFMKSGESWPNKHNLSSLRLLGTVGEPINPEAWMWYHAVIGGGRCPIVDTWWQTETGAIMISPLPGATTTTPGTATQPLPGILADVVRKDGTSCKPNEGGFLVIKHPWPSMIRTVFGDDERYRSTYWSEFPKKGSHPGWYFTGDGARRDRQGNIWIMGRVDDVVNVSGHRLGTAEIESALVSHPAVAEAAVVARPDEIKGNALVAFVTVKQNVSVAHNTGLAEELRTHVGKEIGHIAKPDEIRFAEALPKTRSGKIMRRLLRELVAGGSIKGDVTTLEDMAVLQHLRDDE